MKWFAILAAATAVAGCGGKEVSVPIAVDNGSCDVFEPYRRSVGHLDKRDRLFVRQHNAGGRVLCKNSDNWKGEYYQ